jgi:adenylate cyclase class IV
VRVKLVAPVKDVKVLLMQLQNDPDVIPKGGSTYVETLLLIMAGAYGAPDLYGIRVWNEDDEHAALVHYGQDLRNQDETVVETGRKDDLAYKLQNLGYQPIGDFHVSEWKFRWHEFFGDVITIQELGSFIRVYREFPGSDTNVFAEKQKRAYEFLHRFGFTVQDFLPYDVRGFLVMMILQQAQQQAQQGQGQQ